MPLPLTPFAPLMGASQPQGGVEPANPATLAYQLLERMESSLPKGMASDQTQTAGRWSECSACECSASERVLTTRTPKMIRVSKAFFFFLIYLFGCTGS